MSTANKILIGNIKGPQGQQGKKGDPGEKGDTGRRGSRWSSGNMITGNNTEATVFPDSHITDSVPGDQYINTVTGNVYSCIEGGDADTATWSYTGNIYKNRNDKKPMFVFIDDDGASEFKELYEEVLKPRNIIGGLSIIANASDTETRTYLSHDEILEFQDKGWTILNHSTDSETITPLNMSSKIGSAIAAFQYRGYKNRNRVFVYPDDEIHPLTELDRIKIRNYLKDYFSFGIGGIGGLLDEPIVTIDDKFDIPRWFMDPKLGDQELETFKSYVDETISSNKIMILSTNPENRNKEALIKILDYILDQGGRFYTPDQMFDILNASPDQAVANVVDGRYHDKYTALRSVINDNNVDIKKNKSSIEELDEVTVHNDKFALVTSKNLTVKARDVVDNTEAMYWDSQSITYPNGFSYDNSIIVSYRFKFKSAVTFDGVTITNENVLYGNKELFRTFAEQYKSADHISCGIIYDGKVADKANKYIQGCMEVLLLKRDSFETETPTEDSKLLG